MASKLISNDRAESRPAFWRNSVYEEPAWVSLVWIIAPVLLAGIAIYIALR
jgi:hypothetical protein